MSSRKSEKSLYRLVKFKIVRLTNNTYITDTGKVFRKNDITLKRNFDNHEGLAKRSAAAPIRGDRIGQTLPPRNIAPRGQITMPTERYPFLIVPTPHVRSADPPVILLSDSDTQEALSGTQSPRRSPRSISTPQRVPRISSALLQGPSAQHVPQTPSTPSYPPLPSDSTMGGLDASNNSVVTLHAIDTVVTRTPTLRSWYAIHGPRHHSRDFNSRPSDVRGR